MAAAASETKPTGKKQITSRIMKRDAPQKISWPERQHLTAKPTDDDFAAGVG